FTSIRQHRSTIRDWSSNVCSSDLFYLYSFFGGIILLFLGYYFYSKVNIKNFGVEPKRQTPAYVLEDGSYFIPMSKNKNWLIQLLNIAGTGQFLVLYWELYTCLELLLGFTFAIFVPQMCLRIIC